jgi:hypothetical protein
MHPSRRRCRGCRLGQPWWPERRGRLPLSWVRTALPPFEGGGDAGRGCGHVDTAQCAQGHT